jgi:hypothetical protein
VYGVRNDIKLLRELTTSILLVEVKKGGLDGWMDGC